MSLYFPNTDIQINIKFYNSQSFLTETSLFWIIIGIIILVVIILMLLFIFKRRQLKYVEEQPPATQAELLKVKPNKIKVPLAKPVILAKPVEIPNSTTPLELLKNP